jgi:hypothetical protein
MVAEIAHDDPPVAVNSNIRRAAELAAAAAMGSHGSNVRSVTVPQHLHAVVAAVSHKNVP